MTVKQVPFTLTVQEVPPLPDFFPTIAPSDLAVYQGSLAAYAVTFEAVAGFVGPVTLSVSGLPEGAVATFDSNPLGVGQTANLSIATTGVGIATYNLMLVAEG